MAEKTLSEKCRDGEGTSPINPFALLFQLQAPEPALVEGDLFGDIWVGGKYRDLFEGDLIISRRFPIGQFTREAFGPIAGPVLLTRWGYRQQIGNQSLIYRIALSLENDVSGSIFARGDVLFSKRLGFAPNATGTNIYPAFPANVNGGNDLTMEIWINRVVRASKFYVLMEVERIGISPDREPMQYLEIRYLNRPIKESLNILRVS